MKLSNWIRFTWDLTKLPAFENHLPEHYEIAPATAEDLKELRKIISTSFVSRSNVESRSSGSDGANRVVVRPGVVHLPPALSWRCGMELGLSVQL